MPVIHAPLNDDDFVDLSNMARDKGMTRSALASHILIAAIRKAGRAQESEFTAAALEDAKKFNSQGLPLAQKRKESSMSVDGIPMVTLYERE